MYSTVNQKLSRCLRSVLRCCKRYYVPGRATTDGTQRFLALSQLQLYHKFEMSNLFISPVIHGPPRSSVGASSENDDNCMIAAVGANGSNCIYTYNRTSQGIWHSKNLAAMCRKGIPREGLVAVANLGDVRDAMMLPDQVYEAQRLTDLEALDIVTVAYPYDFIFDICGNSIDDINIRDEFQMVMGVLEGMAASSMFSSYGLVVAFPPYTHHTPSPRKNPTLLPLPAILEEAIRANTEYCDLMLYPLSPTHSVPATRGMLDPDEEYLREVRKSTIRNPDIRLYDGDDKDNGDDENGDFLSFLYSSYSSDEAQPRFSRAAMDPVVCYRGHSARHIKDEDESTASDEVLNQVLQGKEVVFEDGSVQENDIPMFLVNSTTHEHIERTIAQSLDELCPDLANTPALQDKAIRIAMSQGVDCVVVEAEMSALMGKCTLKPEHMMHSTKTDHIYGKFMIPRTFYRELLNARASFVPPTIEDDADARLQNSVSSSSQSVGSGSRIDDKRSKFR